MAVGKHMDRKFRKRMLGKYSSSIFLFLMQCCSSEPFVFSFTREAQKQRERILNNLTTMQQEQTAIEEQRLAEAVAVMSMKQKQQQQEKERKKSEMLKTVAEQMEIVVTSVFAG